MDYLNLKVTDNNELEEIVKIKHRLNTNEEVRLVAKQSRIKPGGSSWTPNTIFVTDNRILVRNPSMLGARENTEYFTYDKIVNIKLEKGVLSSTLHISSFGGLAATAVIEAIPKNKAELILKFVRHRIEQIKVARTKIAQVPQVSLADELQKIGNLKQQGILTEDEFNIMKQEIINKMQGKGPGQQSYQTPPSQPNYSQTNTPPSQETQSYGSSKSTVVSMNTCTRCGSQTKEYHDRQYCFTCKAYL